MPAEDLVADPLEGDQADGSGGVGVAVGAEELRAEQLPQRLAAQPGRAAGWRAAAALRVGGGGRHHREPGTCAAGSAGGRGWRCWRRVAAQASRSRSSRRLVGCAREGRVGAWRGAGSLAGMLRG
jgi:hypothetical protein